MPKRTIDNTEVEGLKLLFEVFKHLTTLSTGAIVILATFLKDIFQHQQWKVLIPFVFVCFLISTVGSVCVMLAYAEVLRTRDEIERYVRKMGFVGIIVSAATFLIGVVALVVFSVKNFS